MEGRRGVHLIHHLGTEGGSALLPGHWWVGSCGGWWVGASGWVGRGGASLSSEPNTYQEFQEKMVFSIYIEFPNNQC